MDGGGGSLRRDGGYVWGHVGDFPQTLPSHYPVYPPHHSVAHLPPPPKSVCVSLSVCEDADSAASTEAQHFHTKFAPNLRPILTQISGLIFT